MFSKSGKRSIFNDPSLRDMACETEKPGRIMDIQAFIGDDYTGQPDTC